MTGTDQSPSVSRAFTSRLREVLTARLPRDPRWVVWVDGVVEELADVTPPQGIDRDALEAIADLHLATGAGWKDEGRAGFIEHVRAILAKVGRPTIDRGALLELLSDETGWEWDGEQDEPAPIFGCDTRVPSSRQSLEAFADRILALVRPVEGVVLSPEDGAWPVHARPAHPRPSRPRRAGRTDPPREGSSMTFDFGEPKTFALNARPVMLSPYVPRGSALSVAQLGPWTWASGGIFMHPLDFHERGYERDPAGRIAAGVNYLLREALSRLDALQDRLETMASS